MSSDKDPTANGGDGVIADEAWLRLRGWIEYQGNLHGPSALSFDLNGDPQEFWHDEFDCLGELTRKQVEECEKRYANAPAGPKNDRKVVASTCCEPIADQPGNVSIGVTVHCGQCGAWTDDVIAGCANSLKSSNGSQEQEPKRGEVQRYAMRLDEFGNGIMKLAPEGQYLDAGEYVRYSDHAAKVAELERELSTYVESCKHWSNENADLRKQLAEAKAEIEERTRQLAEVEQIRKWFDAFQGGAEKILEMSREYVDLKNDNEELKQVNASYDEKLTHARGEIRNAESQLAAEREKRERLREGIEDSMSALNEARLDKAWADLRSSLVDDDAGGGE